MLSTQTELHGDSLKRVFAVPYITLDVTSYKYNGHSQEVAGPLVTMARARSSRQISQTGGNCWTSVATLAAQHNKSSSSTHGVFVSFLLRLFAH